MTRLSQTEWERLIQMHPQREGEQPSDWMERLRETAARRVEPGEPTRLPCREPGEDDAA